MVSAELFQNSSVMVRCQHGAEEGQRMAKDGQDPDQLDLSDAMSHQVLAKVH